jgi:muramidase (phage lysozyme)
MPFKNSTQSYARRKSGKKHLVNSKNLLIVSLIACLLALYSLFNPVIGHAANRSYAVNNSFSANVRAFLDVIAHAEGTAREDGYNTMFTGITFNSFNDHPRQINCISSGLCSDAAGRYQFLSTTWDQVAAKLGLRDFSPASQDLGAVELIKEKNALEDVEFGRFESAVYKLAPVWASFPNEAGKSVYGQPNFDISVLQSTYQYSLAYHQGIPSTVPEPEFRPLPGCDIALWGECRDESVTIAKNLPKSNPTPPPDIECNTALWGKCSEEKS